MKHEFEIRQDRRLDLVSQIIGPERQLASQTPPNTDGILEEYEYEPYLMPNDCEALLQSQSRPGYTLDEDRLAALESHPRFVTALRLDTSSLLFINANSDTVIAREMSIVSVKAYKRAAEIASNKGREPTTLIPLAFFCGQHGNYSQDVNGKPSELVMSLTLQLLDKYRNFAAEDVATAVDELDPDDTRSISSALAFLLSRLPASVIVVAIVDGVTTFEQPAERREAMMDVAGQLVQVHAQEREAVVKFVLTSSSQSECVQHLFTDDDTLTLPRVIPGGGGYFTLM